jgi:hypothetical protein
MVTNKKINLMGKVLILLVMVMISFNMVNAVNVYEYTPQIQNQYMLYNDLQLVSINSLLDNDFKILYNMDFVGSENIMLFSIRNTLLIDLNYSIQVTTISGVPSNKNIETIIPAGEYQMFLITKEFANEEKFFVGAKCNNCPALHDTDTALYLLAKDITIRTTIFSPLITAFVDLVIINISLWEIAYYLIILGIIVGVFAVLIIGAYRFYVWADKLNIFERKRSNHKK